MRVLAIRDLAIAFKTPRGALRAVDGVSLDIRAGRITALVGESGSGKSATALAVLRLLPDGAAITSGRIEFDGCDLVTASMEQMRQVRGRRIGMIFQEPATALNPVMRIGRQLAEAIEQNATAPAGRVEDEVLARLAQTVLPDPPRVARMYPHQLSGGMRQRVMIAIALAGDPELVIADEPTTALDVTVQAQVLALLRSLTRDRGRSLLLITHDFGVVRAVADDVVVMYAGRVVEHGRACDVLGRPRHPYTAALLRCVPSVRGARGELPVIPGAVATPAERPAGCRFHPRCVLGHDDVRCRSDEPELSLFAHGHGAACWKSDEVATGGASRGATEAGVGAAGATL